jgi:Neprosin
VLNKIIGLLIAIAVPASAAQREFTLPSGDRIQCIDADSHPSFPPSMNAPIDDERAEESVRRLFGMDSTRQCPANTIPKLISPLQTQVQSSSLPHEWAAAYSYAENRGGRATFNVWNPFVEQPGEFSLSQLWLTGGTNKGQQTLEAGWHVFPNLYGDNRTRLFIYSSVAGTPGGCYNLDCGRFVQTSSAVILGAPLACTSVDGGPQCEVTLEYARSDSGDWWLKVDGAWIGYYPASLFDPAGLGRSATAIEVGGEIVNQSAQGVHTATSMGSGRPPSEGYGHAAYIRNIQYLDMGSNYRDVASLSTTTPNGNYNIAVNGTSIFFGGPGRVLSETKLVSASPASSALSAPSTLAIAFTIQATLTDNVIVGAALQPAGSSATAVAIAADDRKVAVAAGSNTAVRSFEVPAGVAPGAYDLTAAMWRDMNRNGVIDVSDQSLGTLTYPNAITVAATRKRAAH